MCILAYVHTFCISKNSSDAQERAIAQHQGGSSSLFEGMTGVVPVNSRRARAEVSARSFCYLDGTLGRSSNTLNVPSVVCARVHSSGKVDERDSVECPVNRVRVDRK